MMVIISLTLTGLLGGQDDTSLNLMPVPARIMTLEGKFRLDPEFTIGINGVTAGRSADGSVRMLRRLSGRTGLFFSQGFPILNADNKTVSLRIIVRRIGRPVLNEDESYTLQVTQDKIELVGNTDIGVLRGLETFLQLIASDDEGYYLPAVKIEDTPRFPWRGLMIDACRHFMPVEVVKRNIDGMAAVKMNVLHWHLTEDQGFRIECKAFPKLHEMGSDGLYYTQEQIKDIVKYADSRGIRVVPEFDLPGHATSWLVGYPELASAPGPYQIERNWGIFDPTFDPTNKQTYKFLEKFFREMATLFPDEYWHIGGDENNGHQWDNNPQIQQFMVDNGLTNNHSLQNYFNANLEKILDKLGKTMVGWYTDEQPDLGKKYVIQSWKGRESLYESARNGYRCLLSHGFYIDLIQPTVYHYQNDPIPADSVLTEAVARLILGGEATMWAEFVGPETIDSRIWPRTAAIAERLWSPVNVTDVEDMFRRLEKISIQMEELGLTHEKNYEMMLRRLANNKNVEALRALVDVVEPMYTYSRDHPHVFKSYYPLTRVVDAARPDPPTPRRFERLVNEFLAAQANDSSLATTITKWLTLWQTNHERLLPVINGSPILKEIEPLSRNLAQCAGAGLKALDYLKQGNSPGQEWVDTQMKLLKSAAAPRGEVELLIIKPIEKLIMAIE